MIINQGILWHPMDSSSEFIQIREGGGKVGTGKKGRGRGRGYGFPIVGTLTFTEVLQNHPEYSSIVTGLKDALIKTVKEMKTLKIIEDKDLM